MKHIIQQSFYGPNWHADYPACEWLVVLSGKEKKNLAERGVTYRDELLAILSKAGLAYDSIKPLLGDVPRDSHLRFAFLLNRTALALQRHAGHRVRQSTEMHSPQFEWLRALYETEHTRVGVNAGQLALHLMAGIIPSLEYSAPGANPDQDPEAFIENYRRQAAALALPEDTRQLIAAARRAEIPWMRLDQAPFRPSRHTRRIRFNGGLNLGQGRRCRKLDGTFCRTGGKKLLPYVNERISLTNFMASVGVTLPCGQEGPVICHNLLQAVQASERLGYPVAIKSVRRRSRGVALGIRDLEQLMTGVNTAQKVSKEFIVERMVPGETWRLIVSNGQVAGALREREVWPDLDAIHDSVLKLAEDLALRLNAGLLVITVVTADIGQPLEDVGGAVVDLDLAPKLDRVLAPDSSLWEPSMDAFIRWLYPPGTEARIPIVAVTGSNGKTTTCRMIAHLAQHAGHLTGLACSDGLYLDGRSVHGNRDPRRMRELRFRLLRENKLELAVMEYDLVRIKSEGFPFDFCNVGVITNVVPEQPQLGLESPQTVAEAHQSVLLRAKDGVVLNADDEHTGIILKHLAGKRVVLTSTRSNPEEVRGNMAPDACCVLLEDREGRNRIVIHDGGARTDLMEVGDIPATFGGSAGFNVENALQAIATGYLLGLEPGQIREAMAGFGMSWEQTPGRLNIHDDLPFRVIMDHARNGDGIRKLCEFTDSLDVLGRRILMYSVSRDPVWEELEATVRAAAAHFDIYVLRLCPGFRGHEPEEVRGLMREALVGAGVAPDRLTVIPDHSEAMDRTLAMGRPGDLLVMTPGVHEMAEMWARIQAGPSTPE